MILENSFFRPTGFPSFYSPRTYQHSTFRYVSLQAAFVFRVQVLVADLLKVSQE